VVDRDNRKQINELRKTVEGRNMLRKLGYQVGFTSTNEVA